MLTLIVERQKMSVNRQLQLTAIGARDARKTTVVATAAARAEMIK
jgi:hypothetical protein